MRIALAQLNFTVGAFRANFLKMEQAIDQAKQSRADLLLFTELASTGYPPRDLVNRASFVDENLALLDRVASLSDDRLGIILGFVDRNPTSEGKSLYNAAALCHRGTVAARRYKCLLPTYDVFDEDRYFEPALEVEPVDFRGIKLGLTICEDVWNDPVFWPTRLYHRDPVGDIARQGANLLLNISSSPFNIGKAGLRREMIRQAAMKHGLYFFYVNQVGANDELVFDGHSLGFDPTGQVILRARDFEEDFVWYDVPDEALIPRSSAPGQPGTVRAVSETVVEEAYDALVMGLRDYTRKCGFSSVVLGLSGGIDSALTACLAADALGTDHVAGVAMPSRYSSEHSVTDARDLANTLGIDFQLIPIDPMFQAYLSALDPLFAGLPPGVAEENIQTRIRGAILMALSNKFGWLVLSTGNKSELAVGYCTLYGDMCGGLSVLSDVPKTFVYDLAKFVNRHGPRIPESTILKPPSAELRPGQQDTDELPPYDVLDVIIEAYIERDFDINQIVALGFDRQLVVKVTRMIDRNEYKRRQAAPGLKLTTKAFGMGRRFPIAAEYDPQKARVPAPIENAK